LPKVASAVIKEFSKAARTLKTDSQKPLEALYKKSAKKCNSQRLAKPFIWVFAAYGKVL
jgi:hypothetical protein